MFGGRIKSWIDYYKNERKKILKERFYTNEGKRHGKYESFILDGNNILEVYTKLQKIVADVREHPRPVLIEFMTFRVRGHEEASGTKYVPKELLRAWDLKDPLENYTAFLRDEKILTEES